jgi:hypothetical protein
MTLDGTFKRRFLGPQGMSRLDLANGMAASGRIAVLAEAARVSPLSALMRRSLFGQRSTARDPERKLAFCQMIDRL